MTVFYSGLLMYLQTIIVIYFIFKKCIFYHQIQFFNIENIYPENYKLPP